MEPQPTTTIQNSQPHSSDALMPSEMAARAEKIGQTKAHLPALQLFVLAILAGAFIGLGALFSTIVGTGLGDIPYGLARLVIGVSFSLGLILVIVGGAELFTGNNMIIMAWAGGSISTKAVLRNWSIVFVGNFFGAVGTALLVYWSGIHHNANGEVAMVAIKTAESKMMLGYSEAFVRGILCNALVCLAIWLTYSARTTTGKVLVIVPPITAFVAAGLEHSIANMYFFPLGKFLESETGANSLDWSHFFIHNLIPVTAGNIVGGGVLVATVYWFVYLRPKNKAL